MKNYFDLISLIAFIICLQSLWGLFQNWSSFWDAKVTAKDRELSQRLAVFVLMPIAVLLHEFGHSLATWQVGGTVLSFQWRFFWGYIIPSGDFTPTEYWWIAASGNIVSLLLGLLSIALIGKVRNRILEEVFYTFAGVMLINALIIYPLFSLVYKSGDWVTIYDFTVQPYATVTLILHTALVGSLWHLYHSRQAITWRLGLHPKTIETWKKLKETISDQPDDLESNIALAYFFLQHNEIHEAKKIAANIHKLAPDDNRAKVFQVCLYCAERAYQKAFKYGRKVLATDLLIEDRIRVYRILCFSLYQLNKLPQALDYASQGLELAPKDYKLRYHRAIVYRMLKKEQESKADLEIALANAPDDESRETLQS